MIIESSFVRVRAAVTITYGANLTLSGTAPRVVMELMRRSDIKLTMKISSMPEAAASRCDLEAPLGHCVIRVARKSLNEGTKTTATCLAVAHNFEVFFRRTWLTEKQKFHYEQRRISLHRQAAV